MATPIPHESSLGLTMEMAELILSELRALSQKVDTLAQDSQQRLTKLETQMHPLIGNGQPGLCAQRLVLIQDLNSKMDVRVKELEEWRTGLKWYAAGVSAVCTVIGTFIGAAITWTFEWFRIHRG